MAGRLVYLMGPSGSGKDTILNGVLRRMGSRAFLAPRVITRLGDDDSLCVSPDVFSRIEAAGMLALSWRANGLCYGVLRHIDQHLAAGQDVFVNGSRAYLPEALLRYGDLVPVLIRVEADLLKERLLRRGREDSPQIEARLDRNAQLQARFESPGIVMLEIDNSGDPDHAIEALYTGLHQWPAPSGQGDGHQPE